jgi:hypothetical protein
VTPRLDRRADLFQFVSAFRKGDKPPVPNGRGPLGDQPDFGVEKVAESE